MKKPEPINEETIEVTIARLLERDESQWKALEEIKRTIERVETKLDNRLSEPLPCSENNRRLDNLEKQVADDHEPRLKDVEKFQSNLNGKLAVWGIVVIVVANLISGVVIAYLAGLIGH